jgi:hypothetical protein
VRFRKDNELAYLACAIDEKAHFYVLKTGNIQISLRAKGRFAQSLKKEFGGTCFKHVQKTSRYWYKVQGKKAARLLEAVLPHLRTVKDSANGLLAAWHHHVAA